MNYFNSTVIIISMLLLQFDSYSNVPQNIGQQKIALITGREARFSCLSEIKVHPQTCRYKIVGSDIQVNSKKECKLTFACNGTIFVVECCFETVIDEKIGKSSFNEQVTANEMDIETKNISDISILKGLYDLKTDLFDFKADKALKIMLLLLLILLMIIICTLVPCKFWFIVKLMRQKKYKTIDDGAPNQPKLKNVNNLERNLINLDNEKPENQTNAELEKVADFPLKV